MATRCVLNKDQALGAIPLPIRCRQPLTARNSAAGRAAKWNQDTDIHGVYGVPRAPLEAETGFSP